jgi:hypothetical protein
MRQQNTTKLLPSRKTTPLIRPDHLKSGLIRGVVFLEGRSLVVFCYLIAYEIWPDKRGGLSRGEQFSSILLSQQNTIKLLPSTNTTPLIRPDFRCNEIAKYY